MIYVIIIAAIILLILFNKIIKIPKFGNMVLITGGVKTGKSTMSVWLAYRQYRRQLRKWWIHNHIIYYMLKWLPFKKCKNIKQKEKPLFYSNVPVATKNYSPLTHKLIQREERFRYGSVIYVNESSLMADSQCIKDSLVNEQMLLLNKLIAHETKGGYLFYDTQSISDNHYAVKRCLSTYFYIHHKIVIPFFYIAFVRELKFSEESAEVNTFDDDVEKTLQMVIIPKKVWKMFDCYCYSILTDNLPVSDKIIEYKKGGDLKARKIITFRKYKSLPEEYYKNNE